jgi:hypothetical protein
VPRRHLLRGPLGQDREREREVNLARGAADEGNRRRRVMAVLTRPLLQERHRKSGKRRTHKQPVQRPKLQNVVSYDSASC